jgi:VWFA-related protein
MIGVWLLSSALALAPLSPPPVFSADVDVVRVDVLVTREGRPVRGLGLSDFELRDNGVLQRLAPTLEEQAALDVVLVLDASESVVGPKLEALHEAAGAFLGRMSDGDRAALLSFDEEIVLRAGLSGDLEKVRLALGSPTRRGATALHDAVYAALRLRGPGARRLAVLVFSDGADNLSILSAEELVQAARRSEAIVYAVTAREPGDAAPAVLSRVAKATGGRQWTIRRIEDLRARFLDALDDIRNRYVLRYEMPDGATPGWHALSVRLKRKEGNVLIRPGYWR